MINVPSLSGCGSLRGYLQYVNSIPNLSHEEELNLLQQIQQKQCIKSAHKLVLHHLRFVAFIAKKYVYPSIPMQDLIQEGNIALMLAIKNFKVDHESKARFVSFAVHHITKAIRDFINNNIKIFKIATSKPVNKALNHLHKAQLQLGPLTNESVKSLALQLNITEENVREAEMRKNSQSVGIDINDDENELQGVQLIDDRYNPETLVMEYELKFNNHEKLINAINQLSEKHQELITKRWLIEQPVTLKYFSEKWGVSQEAVRQQEARILKQIRLQLQ